MMKIYFIVYICLTDKIDLGFVNFLYFFLDNLKIPISVDHLL